MSEVVLYTCEPQKQALWKQISNIIVGPNMRCEEGPTRIVGLNSQQQIVSEYDGDWSLSSLISFCLDLAAQDLQQAQPPHSFSQYAGSL